MSNLESVNLDIIKRIKILKKIINDLRQNCNLFTELYDDLNKLEERYVLSTVNYVCEYYNTKNNNEIIDNYFKVIISGNFISELQHIINILDKILRNLPIHKNYLNEINRMYVIPIIYKQNNIEKCKECGGVISVIEFSQTKCNKCQEVQHIDGLYPIDESNNEQKKSDYNTPKHCEHWLDRIMGLETVEINPADMEKIKNAIIKLNITKKEITCEKIREIFKRSDVKCTFLNEHSTLIVKKLGGVHPPSLDFADTNAIKQTFAKMMKLYEGIKSGNKPYYPYYIYKISEMLFENNSEKLRILNYIHMQSVDTVIKNDKYFQKICENSNGMFVFNVTKL